MGNPLDDFLTERKGPTLKKVAFSNPFAGKGHTFADIAARAAITGGVTTAATGLGVAVNHLYNAATKSRDFKKMLEFNGDLHDHLQEDPKLFNQAFTSLRNANPSFSKDPLIAGNYMRQMMMAKDTAGGKIEAAHSLRSAPSALLDNFQKGSLEGAKAGLRGMDSIFSPPLPINDETRMRANQMRSGLHRSRQEAYQQGVSPEDIE